MVWMVSLFSLISSRFLVTHCLNPLPPSRTKEKKGSRKSETVSLATRLPILGNYVVLTHQLPSWWLREKVHWTNPDSGCRSGNGSVEVWMYKEWAFSALAPRPTVVYCAFCEGTSQRSFEQSKSNGGPRDDLKCVELQRGRCDTRPLSKETRGIAAFHPSSNAEVKNEKTVIRLPIHLHGNVHN
jgi:hypothetical protein